eukprot:846646_1
MSVSKSASDNDAPSATIRRRNLERFKNKIHHKNSDNISDDNNDNKISGKKRRKRDYDSDEYEYNEFLYDENTVETAWKDRDKNYDGSGLECFYKTTLGLETESETELESENDNYNEPMKKK